MKGCVCSPPQCATASLARTHSKNSDIRHVRSPSPAPFNDPSLQTSFLLLHLQLLHVPPPLSSPSLLPFTRRKWHPPCHLLHDHDPSLNALLSRLDPPPNQNHRTAYPDSSSVSTRRFRRLHPFLHLTLVKTLDDDLFSGEGDDDRRLFGTGNDSMVDNGISVSEVVRPGVAFRVWTASLDVDEDDAKIQEEENGILERENANGQQDMNRMVDLVG
ncbi:unnamed protein product [Citrullus colocynthis]|uniref:Uncharacterized protein n=1 Tax=Citrullus colocynthis TaxID=252529 RepID=A0ABP0YI89_9ROSI